MWCAFAVLFFSRQGDTAHGRVQGRCAVADGSLPALRETRSCAPWSQTLPHVGWRKWIPARAAPLRPLTFHYGRAPLVNSSDTPCPEAGVRRLQNRQLPPSCEHGTALRKSSSPCFKLFPARALHHQRDSAVRFDPSSSLLLDPSPYRIKGSKAPRDQHLKTSCTVRMNSAAKTRAAKLSNGKEVDLLPSVTSRVPNAMTRQHASA